MPVRVTTFGPLDLSCRPGAASGAFVSRSVQLVATEQRPQTYACRGERLRPARFAIDHAERMLDDRTQAAERTGGLDQLPPDVTTSSMRHRRRPPTSGPSDNRRVP